MWLDWLEVRDLRNIREATLTLGEGLNVFMGMNAQGKTSLLEAVGLLARGRSFRTDQTRSLIRRGTPRLVARGQAREGELRAALQVEISDHGRRLLLDGTPVTPQRYHGRLEAVVYSTDRLKVVRGGMRERRLFLDRGAGALWPAYRQAAREFERVLLQRNAALEDGSQDLPAWDERFLETGARLRYRRAGYVRRLRGELGGSFRPAGEQYQVAVEPGPVDEAAARAGLDAELAARRTEERRARRSLVGPHRDPVHLLIDGVDAEQTSSGQARSLLLALNLAVLALQEKEHGRAAVALLDDLDSELDDERAAEVCAAVAARGQVLVTTAHEGWARRAVGEGRLFRVDGGEVSPA